MIKCEVIERFDLKDFSKLKNIQRKATNVEGKLFVGDTFECDEDMADYLLGNNILKKVVVKVIEVEPKKEQAKKELEKELSTFDAIPINKLQPKEVELDGKKVYEAIVEQEKINEATQKQKKKKSKK